MRQHDAFGIAGRSRCIDERRQVIGLRLQRFVSPIGMLRRGGPALRLHASRKRCLRRALRRRGAVEYDDVLEPRQVAFDLEDLNPLRGGRDERRDRSESRRMYSVCFGVMVG